MPAISFSGLALGIDGDAVIKAILDSRRSVTLPLESRKKDIEGESKAFDELNTKLLALRGLLDGFLTLSGGGIAKKAVSNNEAAVTATASSGAGLSNLTVNVSSLAKGGTLSFNDRFASADAPVAPGLAAPVEMVFTVGSSDASREVRVSVSSTTTLSEIAATISTNSEGALQASTINVGTESAPQFLLLVSSMETGTSRGSLSVQVPAELSGSGVFAGFTEDPAQDAVFTVNGIGQVTRPTNTVSDLIPGVTLQLKQANAGPVSINVGNDGQKTGESFGKFVEALNEVIKLIKDQDKIERIEEGNQITNKFGAFARTQLDNNLLTDLREAISGTNAGGTGAAVNVLADLGLTIQRDGTCAFDQKKFGEAVGKEPAAVQQLLSKFSDKLATTNGVIASYTNFQGRIDLAKQANEEQMKSLAQKLESLDRGFL